MRRFFYLLATMAILVSCERDIPSGGGITPPQDYTPVALFTYTLQPPLSMLFDDMSDAERVTYTLGDGTTKTISSNYSFKHKYASPGQYTVTARAYNRGGEYADRKQTITIPKPDVYMCGVEYIEAPAGKYYRAACRDDDIWTTTWWHTDYTPLLNDAMLPYTYTFKSPVLMDGLAEDDYYEIYVYQSSSQSSDGTQILRQTISTSTIERYPEYVELVNNPGTVRIRVLFQYK